MMTYLLCLPPLGPPKDDIAVPSPEASEYEYDTAPGLSDFANSGWGGDGGRPCCCRSTALPVGAGLGRGATGGFEPPPEPPALPLLLMLSAENPARGCVREASFAAAAAAAPAAAAASAADGESTLPSCTCSCGEESGDCFGLRFAEGALDGLLAPGEGGLGVIPIFGADAVEFKRGDRGFGLSFPAAANADRASPRTLLSLLWVDLTFDEDSGILVQ